MDLKQFLGPSWKSAVAKIIFGFVMLFVVTFVIAITGPDVVEWGYGWPLHFLEVQETVDKTEGSFNLLFLMLDLLFWYLITCVIHSLYKSK